MALVRRSNGGWRSQAIAYMRFLRDSSIKVKVTLIILLTAASVSVMTCAGFVVYALNAFPARLEADLSVLARVIGAGSVGRARAGEPRWPADGLEALRDWPSIVALTVLSARGDPVAQYRRPDVPPSVPAREGGRFTRGHLLLSEKIVRAGTHIATVVVEADTAAVRKSITRYLSLAVVVFLASAFLALLLSSGLRRLISEPISDLARVAGVVADKKDYSVRAHKRSQDEVGSLTDAFNSMLSQVAIRDAELERYVKALRAKTGELDRANRLKSEFVAAMSHELRTPLTLILGYTELLELPLEPHERARVLAKVRRAGADLLDLINETLDLNRLQAGSAPPRLESVALRDFWAQLQLDLNGLRRDKGTELRWEPVEDVSFMTDRRKLRTIMRNIVDNALKFTQRGEVVVRCRVDGAECAFSVKDTGVGIAPEHLPVIFDLFRQVDGSDTRTHGGVGLGLYVVRALVAQLGGETRVESEPGLGTEFTVILPARMETPSPANAGGNGSMALG